MTRLTAAQVAEQLHVEQATVARWAADNKLRGDKVGRQWLFEQADVDAFVRAGQNSARTTQAPTRTTTRAKRRRRAA